MKTNKFLLALAVTSGLFFIGNAVANEYEASFLSNDNLYSFDAILNTGAGGQIIGMTGTVTGNGGGAITSVAQNPSFPTVINSGDGAWAFDNAFVLPPPYATNTGGWLWSTAAGEFNLWNTVDAWGSGTGAYTLGIGVPSGDNQGYHRGDMTITAVPEPETYAMLMAGLGLMGVIARRRKQQSGAV